MSAGLLTNASDWGGGAGNGSAEGGAAAGGEAKNWWALLAVALVLATAAGNILVCLAISRERRLQNVTNYFLMSLAITDLMVAVLVMPAGILTLITGFFPLPSAYCLAWICLDVLFCTASIMHLCTISVDRYLSLRYPMRFGRNKTRRRVTLKIVFVWLLSLAMSLPLSLMYSQDHASVLVGGTCQIPDPLYKLVGSIVCFYIPLAVMLLTYALTVRLLALQQTQLGGAAGPGAPGGSAHSTGSSASAAAAWAGSGWLLHSTGLERRGTWGRFLPRTRAASACNSPGSGRGGGGGGAVAGPGGGSGSGATPLLQRGPRAGAGPGAAPGGPSHPAPAHNTASSTETEDVTEDGASSLEARELWLTDEPTPAAMSALSHFGAEMLKLSRGLETVAAAVAAQQHKQQQQQQQQTRQEPAPPPSPPTRATSSASSSRSSLLTAAGEGRSAGGASTPSSPRARPGSPRYRRGRLPRRASTFHAKPAAAAGAGGAAGRGRRRRGQSFHGLPLRWRPPAASREADSAAGAEPAGAAGAGASLRPPGGAAETAAEPRSGASSSTAPASPATPRTPRRSVGAFPLPPPCTCPYFGDQRPQQPQRSPRAHRSSAPAADLVIVPSCEAAPRANSVVVTWERRGSSARSALGTGGSGTPSSRSSGGGLRRSATLRQQKHHNGTTGGSAHSSPCLLVRYGSRSRSGTVRSHHSRTSSVVSRTSSRHGRIIRLEQKATKVLGVVFFTFVVLWAPFFVLNLVPTVCGEECERRIDHRVFDFVTWLGYASSMVNPIFYTIFNKVFRQAFKKVLTCQYRKKVWRPPT